MSLVFRIARRYLFAKKSTNAINLITGISVFGLAIGTAVLIIVLSVFNGFGTLVTGMMSNFNPDVKITAAKGKTFLTDTVKLKALQQLPEVAVVSETLEEIAFFEYNKSQVFGTLKGVDDNFKNLNSIVQSVKEGTFSLGDAQTDHAVVGAGINNQLGIYNKDILTPINVYMPKRGDVGAFEQPFKKQFLYPRGAFEIQQEYDNQYIITNIGFMRDLLDFKDEPDASRRVSALEIKLNKGASPNSASDKIKKIFGNDFIIKDRYQQDEAFLKLVNIEKWMSFAILSLTILLIAFNLVGALWMIVLEKQKDLSVMRSMGAPTTFVRNIFLNEGLLISSLGLLIGFTVAVALYYIHTHISGGLVPLPPGFATDRYPMDLQISDFIFVALVVGIIGFLASLPAASRAMRVEQKVED